MAICDRQRFFFSNKIQMYETAECEMFISNPIRSKHKSFFLQIQSEQNINVTNTSVNIFQITWSQEWLHDCQVYVYVESNKKPDRLPHQSGRT